MGRDRAAAERPSGGSDTAACGEGAWEGSSGRAGVGGGGEGFPHPVCPVVVEQGALGGCLAQGGWFVLKTTRGHVEG